MAKKHEHICKYCNGFGCSKCDHIGIQKACRCAECSSTGLTLNVEEGKLTGHLCKKCNGWGFWVRK